MKPIRTLAGMAALLATMVIPSPGQAQTSGGAASLHITPGARADGMGRAFVALPEDATANWWNPAALAAQRDHVFSLMHARLVEGLADDVYFEYLGYAMHLPGWGGIGLSFIYLGYGKSIATDIDGRELGEFSSYELSPQVSIGTDLAPGLSAGMTLKYVYVDLAPAWATQDRVAGKGDTFGADLALLHRMKSLPGVGWPTNVGLNIQNLGPNIAYIDQDQSDPIGRNLKLGFGTRILGGKEEEGKERNFSAVVSYDFNKSLVFVEKLRHLWDGSERPIHNFGAELSYQDFFAFRGGYILDRDGDIKDPTFGIGFVINKFTADYASVPQAEGLDRVNKISLSYRF